MPCSVLKPVTDFQEASRQLATAEALDKTHVNTKLELARARDHVADLLGMTAPLMALSLPFWKVWWIFRSRQTIR